MAVGVDKLVRFVFLRWLIVTGLMDELHAAHLELFDRGHINLGQIVRLVARVDVLSDSLSLLVDELTTAIVHWLVAVDGAGRLRETVSLVIYFVAATFSSELCRLLAVALWARLRALLVQHERCLGCCRAIRNKCEDLFLWCVRDLILIGRDVSCAPR